jgi:pimeloyl-ACP methyl ester carboxylesterase
MPTTSYRPTVEPQPGPAGSGPGRAPPRPVTLRTGDGVTLEGCWRSCADPRAVVVLVHGFAASRDERGVRDLACRLQAAGLDVLAYDARGHGDSGGECAVGSREHLDVASAAGLAATRGRPVVLLGISMGVVAVVGHLASVPAGTAGVAGAVLVSGPARWRMRLAPVGVLTAGLTRTGAGRWAAARWLRVRVAAGWRTGEAPESMLARVPVPVAVVHGAGDRLLASSHGERLHRAVPGRARLDLVEGMGHGLDEAGVTAAVEAVGWVLAAPHRPVGAAPGS